MPQITVLMPFFNGSKFLAETIESVSAQTFKDWEFLIVSEPDAEQAGVDIIEQYAIKDKRIIKIINDTRLGISDSLNKGLEMARGEYVVRVDADDPSSPLRFQKQVKFMDTNPDISVCGSYTKTLTPKGMSIQTAPLFSDDIKAALLFGGVVNHSAVILRRQNFIDNHWRYPTNVLSEDFCLWLQHLTDINFANIPEPLITRRWGFTNISLVQDSSDNSYQLATIQHIKQAIERYFDIATDKYDSNLFRSWNNCPRDYAPQNIPMFLKDGFDLLDTMERHNFEYGNFDSSAIKRMLFKRWNWVCSACGLKFKEDLFSVAPATSHEPPTVSVVLPIFNSARSLRESIDSIITQTYTDWEILAINEADSDDGSAEIIKAYAQYDSRIRLIQNEERLGLAESLNLGLRQARGRYVARLDADDVSYPQRLAKQIEFLDRHLAIGVCGAWQRHLKKDKGTWVHRPQANPERCKTNLLFWCDLCHSTLMLRRDVFISKGLFYNPMFLAEDHELWTRAILETGFANIPEVLGDYRIDGQNITEEKRPLLREDGGRIVAAALERALGLKATPEEQAVLDLLNWTPRFIQNETDHAVAEQKWAILQGLLIKVWYANKKRRAFDGKALLKSMQSVWGFARYHRPRNDLRYPVHSINALFDPNHRPTFMEKVDFFCQVRPTLKDKTMALLRQAGRQAVRPLKAFRHLVVKNLIPGKRIEQWTWDRFKRTDKKIEQWTWDRFKRTDKKIEQWTWDRFKRTDKKIEQWTWKRTVYLENKLRQVEKEALANNTILTDWSFDRNALFCRAGEKIKIGFFFHIPSFWPALEALYEACSSDNRFDVSVIYCDEALDPSIKTDGVQEFLANKGISAVSYKDFELHRAGLHVLAVQTIWDENRPPQYSLQCLKSQGIRLIYCNYGLEFSDTDSSRLDHYKRSYYFYFWRIYTFSPQMLPYFNAYCQNSRAVRALGTPRFDAIYHRERFKLTADIENMRAGRPIFLWKVHFPKLIEEGGKKIIITPGLTEYLAFVAYLESRPDLFFIFMPHPRFVEFNQDKHLAGLAATLVDLAGALPNVYVDENDDYRPSLVHADYILVDRSAVMVEAGALGVPVIFLHNEAYKEPMTDAVEPLIESYYQGSTCNDMIEFVEMCLRGEDPKKEERLTAWKECMPFFDGRCSDRIKDDLVQAIIKTEGKDGNNP